MEILPFPLYHGTSTAFLEDIRALGLGAKDPLAEIGLHEFVQDLLPIIDTHLKGTAIYEARRQTFGWMAEQKNAAMNFQHGQTYLSPSKKTAIRYAVNKRYGSELLSYCMVFLQLLLDREVPGVANELYQRHPAVFRFLDISPSPMLVRADDVPLAALLTEHGKDTASSLEKLLHLWEKGEKQLEEFGQQFNFRLTSPLSIPQTKLWFINVLEYDPLSPRHTLHELGPSSLALSRSA
jgi:hypothetical protein